MSCPPVHGRQSYSQSPTALTRAVQALEEPAASGCDWWLPDLTCLIGPLVPGRLFVVGAMSKNGKSTWAINVLDWLADNTPLNVTYLSTEVSAEEVWTQWGAIRAGVPLEDLEDGSASPEARERVAETVRGMLSFRGRVWVPEHLASPTRDDLERVIREQHAAGWTTDTFVLDHLHRTSPGHNQTMQEHVAQTAKYLKDLTLQDRPFSVVCMAQLKRAGANERIARYMRPYMEQLAWSGAIEQNADVVLGLSRCLRKIDGQTRAALLRGEADPDEFAERGVMRMTCLAHRRRGSAMDRSIRGRLDGLRIRAYTSMEPPPGSGDAWEPPEEEDRVPF